MKNKKLAKEINLDSWKKRAQREQDFFFLDHLQTSYTKKQIFLLSNLALLLFDSAAITRLHLHFNECSSFLNFFLGEDLSPLLKGIQLRFFGTKQENSVSPLFQPSFPHSKALSMIISLVSTNPVRKTNGKVPVQCKLHHFSSLIARWRETCKRDPQNLSI